MTLNSVSYENAKAERINGILKQEFDTDQYNQDMPVMKQIKETVKIYSNKATSLLRFICSHQTK